MRAKWSTRRGRNAPRETGRIDRGWLAAVAGAAGAVLVAMPTAAFGGAAAAPPDISQIEKQIADLQEEVRRLKRANSTVEDTIDDKIRQAKPVAGYEKGSGFFIQNQAGDYKLRLGGYTQLQGRFFLSDANGSNTDQFLFRRVRPEMSGSLTKYVDFKIMPDFAGSSFTLFDAYTDIKPLADNNIKLRAGKFKTPVGLERMQSAKDIEFAERGATTNLVPTRDIGLELWGTPWNGLVTYELGVFDGAPDLGNINGDLNDDFTFGGRVFVQPFVNTAWTPVKGFGAGIAGSYGQQVGTFSSPDLPAYRSAGQATIFRYVTGEDLTKTAISDGVLNRINPQAYYYWGPLGLMGEYVRSRTPVTLGDVSDKMSNNAWWVQASWVLTGEDASFKGVTPANPFDPLDGKWGAVEVAGRYDSLNLDKDAFRLKFANPANSVQRANGFALGVNWYWNKNIKVVLDYFQTDFLRGAKTGDRRPEYVVIGELQLVL